MGSLQNSIDPLSPAPAAESVHAPPHPTEWYAALLETCRALVGLPALTSLVLAAFTTNTRFIAIGTGVAVAAALALRFVPELRRTWAPHGAHPLVSALPWILTAALAIVLVFVVVPRRAVKQDQLLANTWLGWQMSLERASARCASVNAKQKDACLADNLAPVIRSRPQPLHPSNETSLANDLMAGQLLLANNDIRSLLSNKMSIRDRFLGTGFSEPVDQNDVTQARFVEYLVPNLTDRSPNVWVWKLDRGAIQDQKPILEWNLLDVLRSFDPANHADFKQNWIWIQQHTQPSDPHPVLVRFALLDPKKEYSGCLGRAQATRVFMSNLGELVSLTLRDAAQDTGYVVPGKSPEPGLRLYIFVYAPTDKAPVKATWGNVLTHFQGWIKADACGGTT